MSNPLQSLLLNSSQIQGSAPIVIFGVLAGVIAFRWLNPLRLRKLPQVPWDWSFGWPARSKNIATINRTDLAGQPGLHTTKRPGHGGYYLNGYGPAGY